MIAMLTLQSRRIAMAVAMATAISESTAFAASAHDARSCVVEVLYSEMLPIGPLFYHTMKVRLLVTPADRPPFETTVERAIPWQAPPPRQGRRMRMACEQVSAQSSFLPF
jgi:hypothetical protein